MVVLMAAIVVLSGPVAEVLDLPAPTAEAKKKHKKKKKKNRPRPPAFNVVQCPNDADCFGTDLNDFLVGTDLDKEISGKEGNDVYLGNGGDDVLFDSSLTSNDVYTGYEPNFTGFGNDEIIDNGGSADFLDLSSLRMLDDVTLIRIDQALSLDGPGINDITITDHFGEGRIETIKFANATLTGTQTESLAREATPGEQAELKERFDEERLEETKS
ncbi:MAG: hypothetical protein LC781_07605 [Actinobacteria bacterium]|nr:hypothetical protein [Actinomycetota bacterium]